MDQAAWTPSFARGPDGNDRSVSGSSKAADPNRIVGGFGPWPRRDVAAAALLMLMATGCAVYRGRWVSPTRPSAEQIEADIDRRAKLLAEERADLAAGNWRYRRDHPEPPGR